MIRVKKLDNLLDNYYWSETFIQGLTLFFIFFIRIIGNNKVVNMELMKGVNFMALQPKPGVTDDVRSYLEEICNILKSITGNDNWYDLAINTVKKIGDLSTLKTLNKETLSSNSNFLKITWYMYSLALLPPMYWFKTDEIYSIPFLEVRV